MNSLSIRLCKTWDECIECEELQKQIWEMPDYRDAVPANFLITAIKNGTPPDAGWRAYGLG